jgi:PAS domain S-box-containing protein
LSDPNSRDFVEFAPVMLWRADALGVTTGHNSRWRAFTGQDLVTASGEGWRSVVHPDDVERVSERWLHSVRSKKPYSIEYRIRRASDGEFRWHLVEAVPQQSSTGETNWFGTCIDIHDRKRAEEHQKFLTDELYHRCKNMLAVVDGVVRLSWREANPETFVETVSARIASLAACHELLYLNKWKNADLSELIRRQLEHFSDAIGSRITLEGPEVRLKSAVAEAIGMAVHELATNAVKYGALSNELGRIDITWNIVAPEDVLSVQWAETNGPEYIPATRSGFGQAVIKRMVEEASSGKVEIGPSNGGMTWRLIASSKTTIDFDQE